MNQAEYLEKSAATRAERLRWFEEARFGMFVHWGLYSQLGRHEWVMNRECIPIPEYERLADTWHPKERPAREWARLAKQAGMQYVVMTTKHCEGFCLWDTRQTDFNAVQRGPRRDLVREYVEACREFDLRIGFYYVLMDWHHPDAGICDKDEGARRRYVDYVRESVRELMTHYGKIDILWWDAPWPLTTAEGWESAETNAMVRGLQPHILINNRSVLEEDFDTPEGSVNPSPAGRAWEACMTFNGSWGYMPSAVDWRSVREVIEMLRTAAGSRGNLLLNIGPAPDGSVPAEGVDRLTTLGKWLERNGEAVYGQVDRIDRAHDWMPTGTWTIKGNTAYFWCPRWPGKELVIGGVVPRLQKASYLVGGTPAVVGAPISNEQTRRRLFLRDLPEENPDPIAGVCVIKLEFDGRPRIDRSACREG